MIMGIPQLICCQIHMIKEIARDHAASGAWAPRTGPCAALTLTTRH
jgi:hypothetical protein